MQYTTLQLFVNVLTIQEMRPSIWGNVFTNKKEAEKSRLVQINKATDELGIDEDIIKQSMETITLAEFERRNID